MPAPALGFTDFSGLAANTRTRQLYGIGQDAFQTGLRSAYLSVYDSAVADHGASAFDRTLSHAGLAALKDAVLEEVAGGSSPPLPTTGQVWPRPRRR